jgi:hypothetical protein
MTLTSLNSQKTDLGLITTDFAVMLQILTGMFCLPPPLTDTTLWQTTTLSEISLENEQFSVIKVPLSSKDEPFILTIPETVITDEGSNVNGRLFDERATPEFLCKDSNAVFHCFGI